MHLNIWKMTQRNIYLNDKQEYFIHTKTSSDREWASLCVEGNAESPQY